MIQAAGSMISFSHLGQAVVQMDELKAALRTHTDGVVTKRIFPCTVLGQQSPNNVQPLNITAFTNCRCLYFALRQSPSLFCVEKSHQRPDDVIQFLYRQEFRCSDVCAAYLQPQQHF